jgi:hypothetical protein
MGKGSRIGRTAIVNNCCIDRSRNRLQKICFRDRDDFFRGQLVRAADEHVRDNKYTILIDAKHGEVGGKLPCGVAGYRDGLPALRRVGCVRDRRRMGFPGDPSVSRRRGKPSLTCGFVNHTWIKRTGCCGWRASTNAFQIKELR